MAPRTGSDDESLAYPDDPADRDNLPGELLGEELTDPGAYEVAADEAEAEELADETLAGSDDEVSDPEQLAAAESAAVQARSSRPVRRAAAAETAKKGVATPRARSAQAVAERPVGPIRFAQESAEELKKVVWPTWPQVQQYFWAVLVFVLVIITFVGLLDLGLGWALLKLFG